MSDMLLESPIDRISPIQPAGSQSWHRRPPRDRASSKLPTHADEIGARVPESAAYTIAVRARSLAPALLGANSELRLGHGVLSTTLSGLHGAADELGTLRSTLVALAEGRSDLAGARALYASELATLKACFAGTGYAGRTLLDDATGTDADIGSINMMVDAKGQTRRLARYPASSIISRLRDAATFSGPLLADFMTRGGGFGEVSRTVEQWIKAVEADMNEINEQIDQNSQDIEALSAGLGSLVDADLTAEAARLKALRVEQEMNQPRLSLTSGTPSTLMALFK